MICYINEIACTRFKATLLHRDIVPVSVKNYNEWLEGAPRPIKLKDSEYSYSKITLNYFVEGADEKETLLNISNLIKEHKEAVIRFNDINDIKYNTRISSSTPKHIKDQYYELQLVLESDFKIGSEKNILVEKTSEFNCTSNVKTPALITITSKTDVENVKIELNDSEFTIDSLLAGDVIEINGNDYTVTLNGENNPEVVEIWDFPILESGSNHITINNENVSVNVSYVEMYI